MSIDYAPYLNTAVDGRVWWRLEDAVRLSAGYLPVIADACTVGRPLTAPHNGVRANERALLGAFHDAQSLIRRPFVTQRDDDRFVDAREFLEWLFQYTADTSASIPFPQELAITLKKATGASVEQVTTWSSFESIAAALDGWFDKPPAELPGILRERVQQVFLGSPWHMLTPGQRRDFAQQWDYQQQPEIQQERKFWWDLLVRKSEIERQREAWMAVATPTAQDLAQKEARLAELNRELVCLEHQKSSGHSPAKRAPEPKDIKPDTNNWSLLVQAEASRRWMRLRSSGANPTKLSITGDLAGWCRDTGVKTPTGINPSAAYIYRNALRNWMPPTK